MQQEITQLRDKVIKQGWEDNKHNTHKGRYVKAFSEPLSIPSLYRILKNTEAQNKVINKAIKKI